MILPHKEAEGEVMSVEEWRMDRAATCPHFKFWSIILQLKGNFTVKKSKHAFSAIAIDHAHEQNNASVKGDGGAVGLTENPSALRRWMVSGLRWLV